VWHSVGVVPVVSVWQNIPCRVQRLYIVHHLRHLLSAARFSTGPAVVHHLHSGPRSYSRETRRISTRICQWHAAVPTLSSHWNSVSCCSAGTMHHRYANQSQVSVSHHGNISDPPPDCSSRTAPPAQLLWPTGFLCGWSVSLEFLAGQCGIRLLVRTVSDNFWRRFCSQHTDAFSALEVSRQCTI